MRPQSRDRPYFHTETRGGWDSWSDPREIVLAIVLPDGTELEIGDEVLVDAGGIEATVEPDEFTASVEFGGHIERQQAEIESWEPRFETRLSESEFRDAWGDWLSLP